MTAPSFPFLMSTSILIGLLAVAEAIRPGLQLPNVPVIAVFLVALAFDILAIAVLVKIL